jgi:hypothetical protein
MPEHAPLALTGPEFLRQYPQGDAAHAFDATGAKKVFAEFPPSPGKKPVQLPAVYFISKKIFKTPHFFRKIGAGSKNAQPWLLKYYHSASISPFQHDAGSKNYGKNKFARRGVSIPEKRTRAALEFQYPRLIPTS